MTRYWPPLPLYTSIVETLIKKGGILTDTELFQSLQKSYEDLNFRELNKTLMRLELKGLIHVFKLTKKKRRVKLRNSK